ncbi:MAG: helix-turn-helix domain-containing protein, partial [Pseudoxanthomonas sp.]
MLVLVENVVRLMADRGDTQNQVAGRGGLSQRTVGGVVTYGKTHNTSPTLRTVDGLAKAFGVQSWMLFIPSLPLELLKT